MASADGVSEGFSIRISSLALRGTELPTAPGKKAVTRGMYIGFK
jgi:hypothetical protein